MGLVVEALDGGFFEGSVSSLDLAVGSGMLGLGQTVVDVSGHASELEGVSAEELAALEREFDLGGGGTVVAGRGEVLAVAPHEALGR